MPSISRGAPRRSPIACLVLALTVALAASDARAATETQAIGGGGGSPFRIECDQDVLVGIGIRQGDALDQVHLICAAARKGGYLDPPYDVPAKSAGGQGGEYKRIVCPRNSFIRGIHLRHGDDVNDIALHCADVEDLSKSTIGSGWEEPTGAMGGRYIYFQDDVDCGSNSVGYGLHGTAGALVTSLGLICEADPFVVAANQNQQPPADPGNLPSGASEWSAFASNERGRWGFALHQANENTAVQLAIKGCGGFANGCKSFWTTRDRCVAYAESRQGGYWYAAGGGESREQAEANAVRFCQNGAAPANSCAVPGDSSQCR